MAPPSNKKRSFESKTHRPAKKQKRKQQYHSDSEEEDQGQDFKAVNLLDSDDEDIHNATVDDGADSDSDGSSSEEDAPAPPKKSSKMKMTLKKPQEAQQDDAQDEDDEEEEEENEDDSEMDDDGDEDDDQVMDPRRKERMSKSKRNDPEAFATSLSKILSTKLATSKRSDPVLARSAAAHEASQAATDHALEAKARKQLRDQKRRALEKGRVKDVLIATTNETTGELEESTSEIMETERRLRKVAQRGVVKLFNAVRGAQVAAVQAEKGARKEGLIGMGRREEKVNEMTKKGFLDLIASGGGKLSKNALEEA